MGFFACKFTSGDIMGSFGISGTDRKSVFMYNSVIDTEQRKPSPTCRPPIEASAILSPITTDVRQVFPSITTNRTTHRHGKKSREGRTIKENSRRVRSWGET